MFSSRRKGQLSLSSSKPKGWAGPGWVRQRKSKRTPFSLKAMLSMLSMLSIPRTTRDSPSAKESLGPIPIFFRSTRRFNLGTLSRSTSLFRVTPTPITTTLKPRNQLRPLYFDSFPSRRCRPKPYLFNALFATSDRQISILGRQPRSPMSLHRLPYVAYLFPSATTIMYASPKR